MGSNLTETAKGKQTARMSSNAAGACGGCVELEDVPLANSVSSDDVDASVKVLLAGDTDVGKTMVLLRFAKRHLIQTPSAPSRTIDRCKVLLYVDGNPVDVHVHDSFLNVREPAQLPFIRANSYPECDVVVIVFSIDDPTSLEHALYRWIPEVRNLLGDVPILVLGNKREMRFDWESEKPSKERDNCVAEEYAVKESLKAGASWYTECCALSGEGIEEAFKCAVRCVLTRRHSSHSRRGCCIIS